MNDDDDDLHAFHIPGENPETCGDCEEHLNEQEDPDEREDPDGDPT